MGRATLPATAGFGGVGPRTPSESGGGCEDLIRPMNGVLRGVPAMPRAAHYLEAGVSPTEQRVNWSGTAGARVHSRSRTWWQRGPLEIRPHPVVGSAARPRLSTEFTIRGAREPCSGARRLAAGITADDRTRGAANAELPEQNDPFPLDTSLELQ